MDEPVAKLLDNRMDDIVDLLEAKAVDKLVCLKFNGQSGVKSDEQAGRVAGG